MAENIRDPAGRISWPARGRENPRDPAGLDSSRFRQGERYANLRPRGGRTWLLFSVVAGRGWFRSADGRTVATGGPGECWLYRPAAFQEYGTVPGSRWEFDWVHFPARPAWEPWLRYPPVPGLDGLGRLRVGSPAIRRRLAETFAALHRDVRLPGAWREALAWNALERILLLVREGSDGAGGRRIDPRIDAALEAIAGRPGERYTVPDLAAAAHLSPSRFAHLFRAQTGRSVIEAVLQARLGEAARLLSLTPAPIKEIAAELGFGTPFYFSSQFRRRYGVSPRAYRAGRRGIVRRTETHG